MSNNQKGIKAIKRSALNTNFVQVIEAFEKNPDSKKASEMSAYMRNRFEFLGIPTPVRKSLSKHFIRAAKKDNVVNWDFINYCWARPEREFQYLAVDYLSAVAELLKRRDFPRLKRLAVTKPWWDTIDSLDRIIGDMSLRFPDICEILLEWSTDDNIWLRRIAIDHQLQRNEHTNTDLLSAIIINNLGQNEFFINKAIGWALRDYSKSNPDWVKSFIDEHKNELSPLSIREGSKYL